MSLFPSRYDDNDILEAPKYEMVRSVAMLSCVDVLQGDGEDVVIRPRKYTTLFRLRRKKLSEP